MKMRPIFHIRADTIRNGRGDNVYVFVCERGRGNNVLASACEREE